MSVTDREILDLGQAHLGRHLMSDELRFVRNAAARLRPANQDVGLVVLIYYAAIDSRIDALQGDLRRSLDLRDSTLLQRIERGLPWPLMALVAAVMLAAGYALGAAR